MTTAKEELSQWMIQHPFPTHDNKRIQKIIDSDPSMLDKMRRTKFDAAARKLKLY